jgi:hypothetical protein
MVSVPVFNLGAAVKVASAPGIGVPARAVGGTQVDTGSAEAAGVGGSTAVEAGGTTAVGCCVAASIPHPYITTTKRNNRAKESNLFITLLQRTIHAPILSNAECGMWSAE